MGPKDLLARLREWWQAQNNKRKIAIIAAAAVIVITIAVLAQIFFTSTYAPLFTQLDPAEAGNITEELEAMGVSYRLSDGGKTIEVPEDEVYQTRIKLASAGVLVGEGVGFELFDTQRFGITDFEQQVGYQRALQGELQRTIVQLDEVEQARVHLVLPEKSVFAETQNEPSAAIVLKLRRGAGLKPEQVQGIVDIVTGAVEGLQAENVNIVDMQGNILNDALPAQGAESLAVQSTTQRQLKGEYERELEKRIQQMLSRVFGPGAAVAMVTAELNFDHRESTSTVYGPGQVLSQESNEEEGTGSSASGLVGVDGENPELGTYPALDGENQGSYRRSENIANHELDVYQKIEVKSPGEVERLSIAVVIDEASLGDMDDEGTHTQKLNQIQNLIASAVGYDAGRGDQINVSSAPFDSSLQDVFQEEVPLIEYQAYMKYLPFVLGGLLILLLALFLLRRRRKRKREELEGPYEPELQPDISYEPVLPEEPDHRRKARELARERPGDVAEVLKLWLKE